MEERQGAVRLAFHGELNGPLGGIRFSKIFLMYDLLSTEKKIIHIADEYFGAAGKRPQRSLFDCFHTEVHRCDRDSRTHFNTPYLPQKLPFEGQVCAIETEFEQTAQLIYAEADCCAHVAVFLECLVACGNCKRNRDTCVEGYHVERHCGVTAAEL